MEKLGVYFGRPLLDGINMCRYKLYDNIITTNRVNTNLTILVYVDLYKLLNNIICYNKI